MANEHDALLNKLEELKLRYEQIDAQLADTNISADHNKVIALSKEQGKLRAIVGKYCEYRKYVEQIADAEAIIADDSVDAEFRGLAEAEKNELETKTDKLLEEMQNKLVMANDDSISSIIVEIRAGTGGDEAALFARDLYEMYIRYAESRRWKIEQLDFSPTERGGFREIIFNIKGAGVWSELGYEGGGHRVQRVPETESQGRVHTSAATVAVLPEPEELDTEIKTDDVVE